MRHNNERALVVEDDRSWQQLLIEILTDIGLEVDLAESLQIGVEKLRAAPHRVAVVDLSLGGSDHRNQDGLRILEAIHRQDPGCVPLLLTGFATVELAVSALTEHGAYTCLRKENFRRAEFRELVNRALAEARSQTVGPRQLDPNPPGDLRAARPAASETDAAGLALLVEDDAGWRGILSELLVEAGYRPRVCSSFGEARGYLRREKYRLAVVDLSLTGASTYEANMSGYELLSSTQAAGIPTIVVSGVASVDDIERAFTERGIFACLEKQTFDRHTFSHFVDEARSLAEADSELDRLTRREREVLELVAQGLSNKQIAEALVITTNTVKRHLKAVFGKLEVHSRAAAAAKAISSGMPAEWPENKA